MKYRSRYEYTRRFGNAHHSWVIVGARCGLHLHISDNGEEAAKRHSFERYTGGIEFHSRTPPAHAPDDAPDHDDCWVLKAPCWHDGSSLQVSDHWIPFWLLAEHDHERMFKALEERLEDYEAGEKTAMAGLAGAELARLRLAKQESSAKDGAA